MGELSIDVIPCLRDNYAYLISDRERGEAWLVDPSESAPPLTALAARPELDLKGILATHHHHDHVGGIDGILARHGDAWVAAHASDRGRVPQQSRFVDAPLGRFVESGIVLGGRPLLAMWIPGHTRGAIAWYIPPPSEGEAEGGDVFTGDTLFAAGCGRLFEGTPAQMHASLQALTALSPATRMWFGHEYTAANLRFAATVEPDNPAIQRRIAGLGERTTPTTVADERATNPFVRAASAEALGERRAAKDVFRG